MGGGFEVSEGGLRPPPSVLASGRAMPFAYFERLTRRQQAIYLQSDAIATLPLRHPERLRPLVTELGRAGRW